MMSRIDSRHWLWCPEFIPDIQKFLLVAIFKMFATIPQKINIVRYHQNLICGLDNDVPNRFLTLKNFYRSPFSKWTPQYRTNSTLSDFNEILYLGRFMMSRTDSWHWKISTDCHFQNGHHNTAQIQHCSISTKFHVGRLWCPELIPDIDFNILNWLPTSKNFYRSPFSKWPPQYLKNSTLFDFKGSFQFIF